MFLIKSFICLYTFYDVFAEQQKLTIYWCLWNCSMLYSWRQIVLLKISSPKLLPPMVITLVLVLRTWGWLRQKYNLFPTLRFAIFFGKLHALSTMSSPYLWAAVHFWCSYCWITAVLYLHNDTAHQWISRFIIQIHAAYWYTFFIYTFVGGVRLGWLSQKKNDIFIMIDVW